VVVHDVPDHTTVVGIPAREVRDSKMRDGTMHDIKKADEHFDPYGTPTDDLTDPTLASFDDLRRQIDRITQRLAQMEAHYKTAGQDTESGVTTQDEAHDSKH